MKVLSANQIKSLESETMLKHSISEITLMEKAGIAFFRWMMASAKSSTDSLHIFCGPGNNGGDGLVVGRMALKYFKEIRIYVLNLGSKKSTSFQIQLEKLRNKNISIEHINKGSNITFDLKGGLVIDAILGIGINRPFTGYWKDLITIINKDSDQILSLDIPSGVHPDHLGIGFLDSAICADKTCCIGLVKKTALYEETSKHYGYWDVVSIGLDEEIWNSLHSESNLITYSLIKGLIPTLDRRTHKGNLGYAGMMVGSYGMAGAALLSINACLRSGVGKCKAFVPDKCIEIIQSSCPEAIIGTNTGRSYLVNCRSDKGITAYGIGCGIGQNPKTIKFLNEFLSQEMLPPLVLDADALNIIASHKWLYNLPEGSIITPHPGEFKRLFGTYSSTQEREIIQAENSIKYKVIIVCKGPYTLITDINGDKYFNSNGNPGMATSGSGDVLTGLITGLLAQGLNALNAAICGVYLHGKAGDLSYDQKGLHGLIARDIVRLIPSAIKQFEIK